jgi:hypothetical protein
MFRPRGSIPGWDDRNNPTVYSGSVALIVTETSPDPSKLNHAGSMNESRLLFDTHL